MNPLRGASYAAILGMVISLTPALAGAWFAIRPSERLLSYMRPLSLAGIFAALCTISLGMTNGAMGLSRQPRFNLEDAAGRDLGGIRRRGGFVRVPHGRVGLRRDRNAAARRDVGFQSYAPH